jgi:hypothetical protein
MGYRRLRMKRVIEADIAQMQKLQACIRETVARIEGTKPISLKDEVALHDLLGSARELSKKLDNRISLLTDTVRRTEVASGYKVQ